MLNILPLRLSAAQLKGGRPKGPVIASGLATQDRCIGKEDHLEEPTLHPDSQLPFLPPDSQLPSLPPDS